jgi:hypothetical protein
MHTRPNTSARLVRAITSGGSPKVVSAQTSPSPRTIANQANEIAGCIRRRRLPPSNITIRLRENQAPVRNNAWVKMGFIL